MKVLGLDISTKTGYAVMDSGKLVENGLLSVEPKDGNFIPDFNYYQRAVAVADTLSRLIYRVNPDVIFVEETNGGRFRQSQKQLEFIHCLFIQTAFLRDWQSKVYYVDTSRWRSVLKIRMTKEQRKHNKSVKEKKARGKITPKHLAVAWANSTFGVGLKKKDHDIADAIAIAEYGRLESLKPKMKTIDPAEVLK